LLIDRKLKVLDKQVKKTKQTHCFKERHIFE
jgi:hypothetical protein